MAAATREVKAVHVWRPRRAAFGELVMMDSSPYRWLEERGPACHLIALIDDASSRVWGWLVEHDSTEENLRTLQGWLERYGRPLALYTDKNSLFVTSRPVQWQEQLRGEPARTQFGRALAELNIGWIAAHSPQAKGRVERLFGVLQDRLVKEMRLQRIVTLEQANRFLETTFWPFWQQRFAVQPVMDVNAYRPLEGSHRLEEILSVRVARTVAADHTVSWQGQRWESARTGLRRLTRHSGRDRTASGRFALAAFPRPLPAAARLPGGATIGDSFRPTACRSRRSKRKAATKVKTKYIPPPDHPWRKDWKRTFPFGRKPDISTLHKPDILILLRQRRTVPSTS